MSIHQRPASHPCGVDLRLVGDVHSYAERFAAGVVSSAAVALLRPKRCRDRDAGALREELPGDLLPDAARCARHKIAVFPFNSIQHSLILGRDVLGVSWRGRA